MTQRFRVSVTAPAKGGDGIGRAPDGRVVFVAGGLPGDVADVELREERKDYLRVEITELVIAAPSRVVPPCPGARAGCGGCDLQHLAGVAQIGWKRMVVEDALRRQARLPVLPPIVEHALPVAAYRTSVRGVVSDGRFAFRRRQSHDALIVEDCLIAHPLVQEVITESDFGACEEVVIRVGARTGDRLVIASPTAELVRVPADVRVVGADELAAGQRAWFHEEIAGVRFRVSAHSFFQANPLGAECLVQLVADALARGDGPVADLYGGVGLFARMSVGDRPVTLVERDPSSVADARSNLRRRPARVVGSAVERWPPTPQEAVIADPARSGLGRAGVAAITATGARVVVLVSCDPASLGRDARLLIEHKYVLESVAVIDQFGQTSHVETVSRFSRA